MTPARVLPLAPHARAPNPRARVVGSPRDRFASHRLAVGRASPMRATGNDDGIFTPPFARVTAPSRASRSAAARARGNAPRINDSTRDRLDRDPRDHTGGVPPTRPRTDRAMSAPRHSTATRRASNERTNETRATTQTVDPSEPRRAAREETTVERAREEEKGEIFEGWMSC